MRRLGIVTGMAAEADCFSGPHAPTMHLTFCAGGNAGRAAAGARALLRDGATALISFGIAGGLDPSLRTGDIVLARSVVAQTGDTFETAADWLDALAERFGPVARVTHGAIATVDAAVATPAAKRALRLRTGGSAVDMESSGIAAVAAEAGIPFIVVRAIADTAGHRLPSAAIVGLAPDGSTRPLAVAAALLPRPWELPALIALAMASAGALRSLRRVAALDLRLSA